jgi:alpha-1,3-mannosyltransferase
VDARQPMMITFANANTINVAERNPAFQRALDAALVLNDGVGIDIASHALFGRAFPENLIGTDLVPQLLATARPWRVYLLGSAPGVAAKAAHGIEKQYLQVQIVGYHHGFFTRGDETRLLQKIRECDPNLVLVAMGQPLQELWAARHYQNIQAPVICVGALLDFFSGRVRRAPLAIRELRLEWVYRLLQEPRRLAGRYLLGNPKFLCRIIWQKLGGSRL